MSKVNASADDPVAARIGERAVVFEYCISCFFLTLRRTSRVHVLKSGQWAWPRGLPYTALTLFLGWWGVPWGIIGSARAVDEPDWRTASVLRAVRRRGSEVTAMRRMGRALAILAVALTAGTIRAGIYDLDDPLPLRYPPLPSNHDQIREVLSPLRAAALPALPNQEKPYDKQAAELEKKAPAS